MLNEELLQKVVETPDMVAQACNPSYSGGQSRRGRFKACLLDRVNSRLARVPH